MGNKIPDYIKQAGVKSRKKDTGDTQKTSERRTIDIKSMSSHDPTAPARDNVLSLRLNAYQKEIISIAAGQHGLTMSGFIRSTVMDVSKREGIF